jgi:hypothetical protein
LDSAEDGFLVTDSAANLAAPNGRLLEMWGISRDSGLSSANEKVIEYVLSKLKNPAALVAQIRSTHAYPDARIEAVIEFKDGLQPDGQPDAERTYKHLRKLAAPVSTCKLLLNQGTAV